MEASSKDAMSLSSKLSVTVQLSMGFRSGVFAMALSSCKGFFSSPNGAWT